MTETMLTVLSATRAPVLDDEEQPVTVRGRLAVARQPQPWEAVDVADLPTHRLAVSQGATAVQPLRHLCDSAGRLYRVLREVEVSPGLAWGERYFALQLQAVDEVPA